MRYPAIARSANIASIVVVRIKLDDAGKVVSATAVSGAKALVFDVMPNIQKWRFRPNAAKAAVIIYEFRLATGQCRQRVREQFVFPAPNVATGTGCEEHWQP